MSPVSVFARTIARNNPAPPINPRIAEELRNLGGTVPSGEFAGQPIYRLAYGQTERHFSRGRMRLRFIDRRVAPVVTQERFFVAREVFARAAAWIEEREKEQHARVLGGDFRAVANKESLSDYLKNHELSANFYQLPDAVAAKKDLLTEFAAVAQTVVVPANWLYLADVKDIEEIGKSCWYLLKWLPPSDAAARRAWADLRWSKNAYVPELNTILPLVDDLGPFPADGFYHALLEIADYEINPDTGEYDPRLYSYAEPSEANCLEPAREIEAERRAMTNQDRNRDWRIKQSEAAAEQEKERRLKLAQSDAMNALGDVIPIIPGDCKISLFNPPKAGANR